MKKTLLFFSLSFFFLFTFFNRYQPVSLDLVKPTTMTVEIKGAVKKPGVYTLKWNDTMQSLISQSGGLLQDADDTSIAYSQVLKDQDVIVIPKKKSETTKLISLNAASKEELETLPGIGPSIATRIIEYRSANTFKSIEQIKDVKGIGEALYVKIKDLVCL